jgi:multiple sugar transport system substrate-binding protein
MDKLQLEAVPFRDANGDPFSVASGTSFVIPMGAKNPAAACAWMIELTSDAAWDAAGEARGETRAKDGGVNTGLFTGSPASDRAIRDQWEKDSANAGFYQVISTYYDLVEYGQSFGASPAGQEIENELNNAITAALLGDKDPEKALADAQKAAMRAYDNVSDD